MFEQVLVTRRRGGMESYFTREMVNYSQTRNSKGYRGWKVFVISDKCSLTSLMGLVSLACCLGVRLDVENL